MTARDNYQRTDDSDARVSDDCTMNVQCAFGLYSTYNAVLLEIMYAIWCCRDVVSSHVLMHLRETLLKVVLCAAFSHCGKSESLRGMVQLQEIKYPDVTLRMPSECINSDLY